MGQLARLAVLAVDDKGVFPSRVDADARTRVGGDVIDPLALGVGDGRGFAADGGADQLAVVAAGEEGVGIDVGAEAEAGAFMRREGQRHRRFGVDDLDGAVAQGHGKAAAVAGQCDADDEGVEGEAANALGGLGHQATQASKPRFSAS